MLRYLRVVVLVLMIEILSGTAGGATTCACHGKFRI
jgi:hypothetical protein